MRKPPCKRISMKALTWGSGYTFINGLHSLILYSVFACCEEKVTEKIRQ